MRGYYIQSAVSYPWGDLNSGLKFCYDTIKSSRQPYSTVVLFEILLYSVLIFSKVNLKVVNTANKWTLYHLNKAAREVTVPFKNT